MRFFLAAPHLLGVGDEALAAAPALATFTQYAAPPTTERTSMERAVLNVLGQPEGTATAPLAAMGAGFDPLEAFVLRADPVTLIAGRDDVLLAGRVDDLCANDANALIALLNAHFISDGVTFHAPRPDAWFITVREPPNLATTPLERVEGSIYPHLPQGEDAATWRRWMSEMQMLLHDHPVNLDRESRDLAPVTGIWIAEGGSKGRADALPAVTIVAIAGPAGDVARGVARRYGADALLLPPAWQDMSRSDDTLAVLPPARDAAHVALLNRDWFAPATTALERGEIKALTLLADGRGTVIAWTAESPSWLARLKARFALSPFAPPASDVGE